MNFYKHHIGDYDQATRHLSFVEDAAYCRLIRKYYADEGPLPKDLKKVQKLIAARTKEEKSAVETVLEEFFTLEEDGWHQKRCDEELEVARVKAERNRQVGKLGGRPRKVETQTEPTGNPDGYETETQTVSEKNPSQTPDTRHQTKEENTMSGKPDDAGAREVLTYLNEQAGKGYREVETNLKLIRAKLASGATVEDCKAVIDAKVAEWGNKPEMEQYLRPETLFGARKFEQYLGQLTQSALMSPAEEAALADGAKFIPGVGRCY